MPHLVFPNVFVAGTTVKEPSRSRGGSRPSISQRLRVLGGDMRSFFSGIIAAVLQTISWQLDRWVVLVISYPLQAQCHRTVSTRCQHVRYINDVDCVYRNPFAY